LGIKEVKGAVRGMAAEGRTSSGSKDSGHTGREEIFYGVGGASSGWGGGGDTADEVGKLGWREFRIACNVVVGDGVGAIVNAKEGNIGGREVF
jgi:hypothetical protein